MVISNGVRPHLGAARDVGPLDLVAAIDATWFGAGLPESSRERLAPLAHTFEAPAGTRLLVEATEDQQPTVDPETGEMREPPEPEIDLENVDVPGPAIHDHASMHYTWGHSARG